MPRRFLIAKNTISPAFPFIPTRDGTHVGGELPPPFTPQFVRAVQGVGWGSNGAEAFAWGIFTLFLGCVCGVDGVVSLV